MSVVALVFGILGLILSIIPLFGVPQMIGGALGLFALVLGILGRKKAAEQRQPTGTATAGVVLGVLATLLSILMYASCMYCQKKGSEALDKAGIELKK
jgi:hypothetical protein